MRQEGESYSDVEGNSRALGVIVHAYIDNAVKYAPVGSTIVLVYEEAAGMLRFSVESLGPPILADETTAIFDLFVRGVEAARLFSDGTGFGLATARIVADALDVEIGVDQEPRERQGGTRLTTAHLTISLDATQQRPAGAVEARAGRGVQGARKRLR